MRGRGKRGRGGVWEGGGVMMTVRYFELAGAFTRIRSSHRM